MASAIHRPSSSRSRSIVKFTAPAYPVLHLSFSGNRTEAAFLRDNEAVAQEITRDPETMHGVPVFGGTRVPIQTLFDYLEGGETLEGFLEGFPTVTRAAALAVLEMAKHLLLARS